jgi:hypothetical protein
MGKAGHNLPCFYFKEKVMTEGKDIFGNPTNTDVQGNAGDKNAQGERLKDGAGNTPKDIYGNESASDSNAS